MAPVMSTSFYINLQHYIGGYLSVSIQMTTCDSGRLPLCNCKWTNNMTSMDVFQYERTKATSDVNLFYMDVQHDIRGRQPVSISQYYMTTVDVYQFLYGRKSCDRGRSQVSLWTYS